MTSKQGRCDLHTHTQASDGMNLPSENVKLAKDMGLSGIAITDHDTVAGVAEALKAGRELGIAVVPGVEISTSQMGQDIHVLGYYINTQDEQLLHRLQELRSLRDRRNEMILANLNKLGISLVMDEVIAGLGRPLQEDESIGRPHIADALVRKGRAKDLRDAFDKYLAEGASAYATLPKITPGEAVSWIRESGGAPVLAHPGIYGNDALMLEILQEHPWAGIEAYHSDHSPDQEAKYLQWAERLELIPTGGSDYHGIRQGMVFHGEIGNRSVPLHTIEQLREQAGC
ncbi:phosphatase [Paenibacillus sp. CAA11]|uniref:PHP domain-containing protein n=1 Tax=Paenibacillus sp. CAA11 TaxID=1532905 RepID=UPI000D376206|nr:PHP domain-containing protein [Paenibacillus sp. CAA11]AWB45175.1 phosphatase [Paenibacillus sp. CAA11]